MKDNVKHQSFELKIMKLNVKDWRWKDGSYFKEDGITNRGTRIIK